MNNFEMVVMEARSAPEADLTDVLALLTLRKAEREAEAVREQKHQEAIAACQECMSRIEQLKLEFSSANTAYLELDHIRQSADERLTDYLARKPGAYASALQTETWASNVSQLKALVGEAKAAAVAADQKRSEINMDLLAAIDELERRPGGLAFRERQLRPRQPAEPHYIGGTLSGVR